MAIGERNIVAPRQTRRSSPLGAECAMNGNIPIACGIIYDARGKVSNALEMIHHACGKVSDASEMVSHARKRFRAQINPAQNARKAAAFPHFKQGSQRQQAEAATNLPPIT